MLLALLFDRGTYKKIYSYRHLINGFAAHISHEQVTLCSFRDCSSFSFYLLLSMISIFLPVFSYIKNTLVGRNPQTSSWCEVCGERLEGEETYNSHATVFGAPYRSMADRWWIWPGRRGYHNRFHRLWHLSTPSKFCKPQHWALWTSTKI